jgi:hypothetical protein
MTVTEDLRDPRFLLWLQQFVGRWEAADAQYDVRRRPDGWLEAYRLEPFGRTALSELLPSAHLAEPSGLRSLAPYPVVLSAPMMQGWLTPEQVDRLRQAWRVGTGMRLIVETIEQNMREMSVEELADRWPSQWRRLYDPETPLPGDDRLAHEELYRQYKQEAL